MAQAPTIDAPPIGRVARWKLTEPLRLYVYGWQLLMLIAACLAAAVSGYWEGPATVGLAGVLTAPAVEAARASAYSPRSVVQTVMRSRQ